MRILACRSVVGCAVSCSPGLLENVSGVVSYEHAGDTWRLCSEHPCIQRHVCAEMSPACGQLSRSSPRQRSGLTPTKTKHGEVPHHLSRAIVLVAQTRVECHWTCICRSTSPAAPHARLHVRLLQAEGRCGRRPCSMCHPALVLGPPCRMRGQRRIEWPARA